MSLRKHNDYNSYLTNLKYNNLGNYLSERNFRFVESHINSLNNTVNNDYLRKIESKSFQNATHSKDKTFFSKFFNNNFSRGNCYCCCAN